jgi:hypothetical protein
LIIEIVNEVVFTICLDLSPIYSGLMTNEEHKYNLGWIFIFTYIGLFLFNLITIIQPPVRDAGVMVFKKVKDMREKKRLKRKVKSRPADYVAPKHLSKPATTKKVPKPLEPIEVIVEVSEEESYYVEVEVEEEMKEEVKVVEEPDIIERTDKYLTD